MEKRILIILLLSCFSLFAQNRRQAFFKQLDVAAGGGTPTIINAWKAHDSSGTKAVTVSPTAGNALIVFAGSSDANPPTAVPAIIDNIDTATGWVHCTGKTNLLAGYSMVGDFWIKFNVPSGITTVTVTCGSAGVEAIIHEVQNVTTFTSSEKNGGTFSASTNPQTGTVNNATAVSIYFAGVTGDGSTGFTINQTGTTGTWNHYSVNSHEDDGSVNTIESVPNIVVSTSTPRGHGWTVSSCNGVQCVIVLH